MIPVSFEPAVVSAIPQIRLGCIACNVKIVPSNERITEQADSIFTKICSELDIDLISQKSTIKETKEAYRKLGKDPSRYRPSAEALTRRIVKGKDLFWINNVVDVLNIISLESGFSIGGYDADKIVGEIEFGIGKADEPYEGIGRGDLNIEHLPVFRDDLGAFGSPTSDSLRTMVTDQTSRFLMVIIDFAGNEKLEKVMDSSMEFYQKYCDIQEIESKIISTN